MADSSVGDRSSWKLCLRFGFDSVLLWNRVSSNEPLEGLLVWIGVGVGNVVALAIPPVDPDSG